LIARVIRLISQWHVLLIPKNNKSAAASVKGGMARPVKNKVTPRVLMPLSRPKPNRNRTLERENPTSRSYSHRGRKFEYSSFHSDNYVGMVIRGTQYLADVGGHKNVKGGSYPPTRILNDIYIHPSMIEGRVSHMAKTFSKYCFRRLTVRYEPQVPTTTPGTLHMCITDDPTADPTVLQNRQLKVFFENRDNSYSGNVYSTPKDAFTTSRCDDERMLSNVRNSTDLKEVYQGRIVTAVSGLPTGIDTITFYGTITLEFELLLVDDAFSIGEIARMAKETPVKDCTIPSTIGPGVITTIEIPADQAVSPGLYTGMNISNDLQSNGYGSWTKLLDAGSEVVYNMLPIVPGGAAIQTGIAFASALDAYLGNPIKNLIANPGITFKNMFQGLLLGTSDSSNPVLLGLQVTSIKLLQQELKAGRLNDTDGKWSSYLGDTSIRDLLLRAGVQPDPRNDDEGSNAPSTSSPQPSRLGLVRPLERIQREQLTQRTPTSPQEFGEAFARQNQQMYGPNYV